MPRGIFWFWFVLAVFFLVSGLFLIRAECKLPQDERKWTSFAFAVLCCAAGACGVVAFPVIHWSIGT